MERSVSIEDSGRDGKVTYREAAGALAGYWEYGGGDVTAILSMGSELVWREHHAWAAGRRPEILRFIADEACRQKAPGSRTEIDEPAGTILIRPGDRAAMAKPSGITSSPHAWIFRLRRLQARLALIVGIGAVLVGGLLWLKDKMFSIQPGKVTPVGLCVRTDAHVATWIQTLEAYTPSLHRDASRDRFTLSVLLVPLDGTEPHLVRVHEGLEPSAFALAKILGSDGRALWVDCTDLQRIDLASFTATPAAGPAPANLVGASTTPLPPRPESFLSAGFLTGPNQWLGLHSQTELAREYATGKYLRRVVSAERSKETRRFHRGTLEPDDSGKYHRILTLDAIDSAEYLDAAFLRASSDAEPLRLTDPDSVWMVFTSAPGLTGTLMAARVDLSGTVLWRTDTGIDRFSLQQILPGDASIVFVGTRPRQPDRVPEPLLVIVDGRSGRQVVQSLWR